MNMFSLSFYSKCDSGEPYLNGRRSVAQGGIFSKNVFNRKHVKFNINVMSKIVFVNIKPKTR